MGKRIKIWMIAASALILIGCMIIAGVMMMHNWDFSKLSTVPYETNRHTIGEDFRNISIITNVADLVLVPCEGSEPTVVCYEQTKVTHSVAVKDGTLVIEVNDERKWYEYIGINFYTPRITISIPQGEYGALSVTVNTGDVELPRDFTFERMDISTSTGDIDSSASVTEAAKIKTTTGDIRIENLSANALDLSVSTGDVAARSVTCAEQIRINVSTGDATLTDVSCQEIRTTGSTGDILLENVMATERFSIERSTGDVIFNQCDAPELFIQTNTGDVIGSLRSDKVFIAQSNTGDVDVPKTVTGGRCEITTNTGDIQIELVPDESA